MGALVGVALRWVDCGAVEGRTGVRLAAGQTVKVSRQVIGLGFTVLASAACGRPTGSAQAPTGLGLDGGGAKPPAHIGNADAGLGSAGRGTDSRGGVPALVRPANRQDAGTRKPACRLVSCNNMIYWVGELPATWPKTVELRACVGTDCETTQIDLKKSDRRLLVRDAGLVRAALVAHRQCPLVLANACERTGLAKKLGVGSGS